jgi:recombination endonuclease VII
VTEHDPRACLCSTHRNYLMDCETFNALWEHAKGICQVCDVRPEDTPHRLLHIDHDPLIGNWGVRGLLCSRCNSSLHHSCHDPARVAAYLADPYWKHILSAAGVPADGIPEPGIGAIVKVGHNITFERKKRGWVTVSNLDRQRGKIRPWYVIATYYGPHRVRVVYDPAQTTTTAG